MKQTIKIKRFLKFCSVALFTASFSLQANAITPKSNWADSYSVGGKCYCATTFDHGVGKITYTTPAGKKTVKEICDAIGKGPGKGKNPVYNTVQCGHEPGHSDAIRINGKLVKDEKVCPGRVDQGSKGCSVKGPKWDLGVFEGPGSNASSSGNSGSGSTSSSSGGTTLVTTTVDGSVATIQAEDYATANDTSKGNQGKAYRGGDVDIQKTSDTGGGFNVGWISTNEWLSYPLNVSSAGAYEVSVRTASIRDSGMFSISVGGDLRVSNQSVPNTGNWQKFETLTFDLGDLELGETALRFTANSGGFNLNWLKLTPIANQENPNEETPEEETPEGETPADPETNEYNIQFNVTQRNGRSFQVDVTSGIPTSDIATVALYIDEVFIRIEKKSPYNWNHKGKSDSLLGNLSPGTFNLKAVITTKNGEKREWTQAVEL